MVRKRRFVMTSNTSTQTDTPKEWLPTSVILQKLSQQQIDNLTTNNPPKGMESHNTSGSHTPVLPVKKRPAVISKPPNSYRIFAKPITNNEIANSTLVSDIQEQDILPRPERQIPNRKVKFMKPGPLSYKQRVLQEFDEDMDVPIMLGEPSTTKRPSLNLETILEHINENTTTPELINLDISSFENLDPHDIAVQTTVSMSCRNGEQEVVENVIDELEQPKNVQMKFNGVTTVISSRSTTENKDSSSSSDEGTQKSYSLPKDAKFVKIKAHTVHIHNHFYNS